MRISAPSGLNKGELAICVAIISGGNAVNPGSAAWRLPRAKSLAVVRLDGRIVGIGAIKRVRPEYALDKAQKSGVTFPEETPELGYVAVEPGHQGKGLSHRIVEELVAKQDGPLFATTSSVPMKKTLRKAGFSLKGCEWEGDSGNHLSLWLKGS